MEKTKICLLGGDARQASLAQHLSRSGYTVAVWGIPDAGYMNNYKTADTPDVIHAQSAQEALCSSRAVILPLPATSDGVRVHCAPEDASDRGTHRELRLTQLLENMPAGALLLAGKPPEVLRSMARNARVRLIDYYDSEEVQLKNAVPTAEGAIAIAMAELPVTLYGASCTVLGCGRIGRRISDILRALGARVTVVARSERDLNFAQICGCRALPIPEFIENPGDTDVIFNTIPVPLLGADTLEKLPGKALIIELASTPGGICTEAQRNCRQKIIRAPSLPGKVAPHSAGEILSGAITKILKKEGVVPL